MIPIHLIGSFVFIFSILVCLFQRIYLKAYRRENGRRGVTGCEAARAILDAHGFPQAVVDFVPPAGPAKDGEVKKLYLPKKVFESTSLYAAARAGHEAVLMIESPVAFLPLKERWKMIRFFSWAAWTAMAAGFYRPMQAGRFLSSFFFSFAFLAAIFFVPNEWEIAERAYELLKKTGFYEVDELLKIKNFLRGIRLESPALIFKAPFKWLLSKMGRTDGF